VFHYYFLCIEFKLAAILTAGTSEIDTSLEFDRQVIPIEVIPDQDEMGKFGSKQTPTKPE